MNSRAFPVGSTGDPHSASPSKGSRANLPPTLKRNSTGIDQGAARRYATRQRVRDIARQLSQRDWSIVADVARLRVVTGSQLRRLRYDVTDSARRRTRLDLARLVEWRVLARLSLRVGGVRAGSEGYAYSLDVLGQRLINPGRRRYRTPSTPGAPFLAHVLAVSELYVQLHERLAVGNFELLTFEAEPASWRAFSGPGGQRLVLKPDAFVVCATGDYEDRYFVEVDRNTESLPRVTDKARLYMRYWQSGREQDAEGVFPLVLWIAPDERRRAQLVDALAAVGTEHWHLFAATTSEQAAAGIERGMGDTGGTS